MEDFDRSVIAKGIFHNKNTGLCIFEINQGELRWYNVHIDNIEGKFYQGCRAKVYQYDNEVLKAKILEPDEEKNEDK